MRLILCKGCGAKVSDQYSCCPKCLTPVGAEPIKDTQRETELSRTHESTAQAVEPIKDAQQETRGAKVHEPAPRAVTLAGGLPIRYWPKSSNEPVELDTSINQTSPGGTPFVAYIGEVILSAVIAATIVYGWLVPYGMVTRENSDLAFWFLCLPIGFIFLTVHTLITGEELKVGKTSYSISRKARIVILEVLFAFVGFLLGGQSGVLVGVVLGGFIALAIGHLFKHSRKK